MTARRAEAQGTPMTTQENGSGSDHVHALVGQRDQLRAWIARLDEVQTGAPSHVAQRIRADYEDRLRRVTEELSAHGEEIGRQLQAMRDELAAAEERRTHAADALEETRLRHLIGELDEAAWEQARVPLEGEVAAADESLATVRGEVEHLGTLAGEIVGAAGATAAADEGDASFDAAAADEPAAGAGFDGGFDGEDAGDDDAGGDDEVDELPFLTSDEPAPSADTAYDADAGDGWEPELEMAGPADTGGAASEDDGGIPGAGPVSGEELAAWITEVEAESTGGAGDAPGSGDERARDADAGSAPSADDVDGWDPFANEFGGSPASPATQPGDATQDLPWLDGLQGGAAGKWAEPAGAESDDLAFLDNLDAPAPSPGAAPAADLAADDLAFLEELDRAISGGAQRGPAGAAPAGSPAAGLGGGFSGGSGGSLGGGSPAPAEGTQEQPRKRGEALLCKECGAINEPQAWYCEICGSEL
jgi:hypothetical protein